MSDPLIPPEDWVTDPDQNYDENYDDAPCPACSALVESRAVHRAWHLASVDRFIIPRTYTKGSTSPGNHPY